MGHAGKISPGGLDLAKRAPGRFIQGGTLQGGLPAPLNTLGAIDYSPDSNNSNISDNVTQTPMVPLATGKMVYATWMKFSENITDQAVGANGRKGLGSGGGWVFWLDTIGVLFTDPHILKLEMGQSGTNSIEINTLIGESVDYEQWYLIAFVYDPAIAGTRKAASCQIWLGDPVAGTFEQKTTTTIRDTWTTGEAVSHWLVLANGFARWTSAVQKQSNTAVWLDVDAPDMQALWNTGKNGDWNALLNPPNYNWPIGLAADTVASLTRHDGAGTNTLHRFGGSANAYAWTADEPPK